MNLSYEELVVACRNIGYDLTCGACAEIFYTGATIATHTCVEAGASVDHFIGPYRIHPDLWSFATKRMQDPAFAEGLKSYPVHVDPVENFIDNLVCDAHYHGTQSRLGPLGLVLCEDRMGTHSKLIFQHVSSAPPDLEVKQPAKRQPMNGPVSGPAVELTSGPDTGEGVRNAFLPELEVKQWLIYRKDLNVRRGKIIAQCAHASMKVFFDNRIKAEGYIVDGQVFVDDHTMYIALNEEMKAWADGLFGKVVLTVADLDNLLLLAKQAEEAGLPVAIITDAGRTEFHGVPTITAIAIGPARCEDAWPIVRDGEVQTKLD